MIGSRFSRSRGGQIAAWFVFCFCIGVIFTGMIVGPAGESVAQTQGVEDEDRLDGDLDAPPLGEDGNVVPAERELPPNEEPFEGEAPEDEPPIDDKAEAENEAGAQKAAFTRKIGEGDPSGILDRLISLFGILFFIGLAWVFSNNRRAVNWRLVAVGIALQLAFATIIFFVPGGEAVFDAATRGVNQLLEFTGQGSSFIFKNFITNE